MKIALTGGLGFIGQEIAAEMLKGDYQVTLVDYWPKLVTQYEQARLPITESIYRTASKFMMIEPGELLQNVTQFDVVIHAGAVVDTTDLGKGRLWDENVHYTRKLVDAMNSGGYQGKMIFISSAATYGMEGFPNNPYGLSKSMGELIVSELKGPLRIVRLFNVFGELEHHKGAMASVPWKLWQAYKKGETFKLHSPDAQRDFVPVCAVVDAVKDLVVDITNYPSTGLPDHGRPKQSIYDLGTGLATSFSDLDAMIMRATGNTVSCVRIDTMPPHLEGRYQGYTCAGVQGKIWPYTRHTTHGGIERYYGKR